jgi:dihydrolipoamide dehydrogenase
MVVGDLASTADVVVLGAGPGGYVAALRAAQLGKDVVLIDPAPPGGTCLQHGCIPTKALLTAADHFQQIPALEKMGILASEPQLDLARMQRWKNQLIERLAGGITQLLNHNNVTFVRGRGWFLNESKLHVEAEHSAERIIFEQAIVAVGVKPAPLRGLNFDDEKVLMPQQALALTELPAEMAIVGGDTIAAELATLFAKLGSDTHLFVPTGQSWLPEFQPEAAGLLLSALKKLGVTVRRDAADLPAAVARFGKVVVSMGGVPNTAPLKLERAGVQTDDRGCVRVDDRMQSSNPAVYAVGDVTGGDPLAHIAIKQGKVAAEALAGLPARFEPQAVPRVAWTDPQLATVGLTALQAEAAGYRIISGRFPLAASGRALTLSASTGFAQTIAEAETELLLGVTIVGPHAETLIGEAALAIEMGATLVDLAETLHPHPGLGETLQESAEAVLGITVHLKNR